MSSQERILKNSHMVYQERNNYQLLFPFYQERNNYQLYFLSDDKEMVGIMVGDVGVYKPIYLSAGLSSTQLVKWSP